MCTTFCFFSFYLIIIQEIGLNLLLKKCVFTSFSIDLVSTRMCPIKLSRGYISYSLFVYLINGVKSICLVGCLFIK